MAIRINDIINGQQADDRGNTLPPNSVRGMVSWFTLAKPKIVGMLAQSDSITGVVRPFACVTTYAVCPSGIYLPSVTVAVGNSTGAISPSLSTCGTNGDCSCIESCVSTPGATLATYNWSSANSSILSLTTSPTASTADYQGMAAGTTSMQLSGADGLGCGASGGGPATVCSLAISSPVNGQVFDTTSGSYNQAALPLNATSSCPGTATWSFSWSYRLISTIAIYTGSTTSTIQTLNQPTTYPTPAGNGGQGATTVQALGKTLNLSVFVDGATIPNATVASTLTSLYGGATPNLLVGVAYIESSCRQFSFTSHYKDCGLFIRYRYDRAVQHVSDAGLAAALEWAESSVPSTQVLAVETLGEITDPRAISTLRRLAGSQDTRVSVAAKGALARMGDGVNRK